MLRIAAIVVSNQYSSYSLIAIVICCNVIFEPEKYESLIMSIGVSVVQFGLQY